MKPHVLLLPLACILLFSCSGKPHHQQKVDRPRLPKMGHYTVTQKKVDGKMVNDTIWPAIPDFSFINQDGNRFTQDSLAGKVYLAEFFFTTCPTICPKMAVTLERVQDQLKSTRDFMIVSHTIDPLHDTPEVLKEYAAARKADPSVWVFLTGDQDSIYEICEYSYMAFADENPNEPGGFVHSGFLVLIDKDKLVRGVYDGTRPELADSIAADVKLLLQEKP